MTKVERTNKNTTKVKRPLTSNLTIEERLQVTANLIIDRIIEDQLNGNLRIRCKTDK